MGKLRLFLLHLNFSSNVQPVDWHSGSKILIVAADLGFDYRAGMCREIGNCITSLTERLIRIA